MLAARAGEAEPGSFTLFPSYKLSLYVHPGAYRDCMVFALSAVWLRPSKWSSILMSKGKILVFDCNETLIDLESLNPVFERILGSPNSGDSMRIWFANMILYSCALTLSESYVPFTDIGSSVLEMLAKARGR